MGGEDAEDVGIEEGQVGGRVDEEHFEDAGGEEGDCEGGEGEDKVLEWGVEC